MLHTYVSPKGLRNGLLSLAALVFAGGLLAKGEVISINFVGGAPGNYYNRYRSAPIPADLEAGVVPVRGAQWMQLCDMNRQSGPINLELFGLKEVSADGSRVTDRPIRLTVKAGCTWCKPTSATYHTGNGYMMSGYIDDGAVDANRDLGAMIRLEGIPYTTYDVYVYYSSDSIGKFGPIYADGSAVPDANVWGDRGSTFETASNPVVLAEGVNYRLLKDRTGASVLIRGTATHKPTQGIRSPIAGIQIVCTGEVKSDTMLYTAELTGSENFSALAWNPKLPETMPLGSVAALKTAGSEPAELTVDASKSLFSFSVGGTAPLTLKAGAGKLTVDDTTYLAADTAVETGAAALGKVTVEEGSALKISDPSVIDSVAAKAPPVDPEAAIVRPSERLAEWADNEIGVLFHYDLFVFDRKFNWRNYSELPSPDIFNPTQLDTDQWARAVKAIGAKYAVLTAKHCPGFCLWPTKVEALKDYNVTKTPYKKDIIRQFVDSCRKYGIKPGLYCSTQVSGYLRVYDGAAVTPESPVTQEEYGRIVKQMLTELWTNYGELYELWFDGGAITEEQGGFVLGDLLKQYQPNAIVFQGPGKNHPHTIRWIGNELGQAPTDCWSTTHSGTSSGGDYVAPEDAMRGNPYGQLWCPGEADCTLRDYRYGGWSWAPNQDQNVYSVEHLMNTYRTSVGRNTNMLIGMVIDDRGLVPDADIRRAEEFAAAVKARYGSPTYRAEGQSMNLQIDFDAPTEIDRAVLQENIREGERVLDYEFRARVGGEWKTLFRGKCIGHKQIREFAPVTADAVCLKVNRAKAMPQIRNLAVYAKTK